MNTFYQELIGRLHFMIDKYYVTTELDLCIPSHPYDHNIVVLTTTYDHDFCKIQTETKYINYINRLYINYTYYSQNMF